MEQAQVVAGSVAGLIFAMGNVNMVFKAWRTRDLRSYSLGQMLLNNVGNLIYWAYVASLPFGPIWFMHSFFTAASLLMLIWYVLYGRPSHTPDRAQSSGQHEQQRFRERQVAAHIQGSVQRTC